MTRDEFDEHILRIQLDGYTVLPGVLTSDECDQAQQELEGLSEKKVWLGNLFNKARVFERVYQIPPLLEVIRHFLGQDAVLSGVYGSILHSGSGGGGLHSDGSITGPNRLDSLAPVDNNRRITSHVLAFNVIFCISNFTKTNGATRVVPGSYKYQALSVPPSPVYGERIVEAERGSTLIFNINTWHGASENSAGETRYALFTPWRRQWLRGESELSRIVEPEVLDRAGEEGKRVFGLSALSPYLDLSQWDRESGCPKSEWSHLQRG